MKLGNSALALGLSEVLRKLTLKTGKRMQLNSNISTICVEKLVPCWLYTKHKFLKVLNVTTSSVDCIGSAFVWIVIPVEKAFKINSLYRDKECMCVGVGCAKEGKEGEKRQIFVEYWIRQAHVPSIIKEHNLKVAIVPNYMRCFVGCHLNHVFKIN